MVQVKSVTLGQEMIASVLAQCIGSESALISKGTKAAVDKPRRLALRKMKEQASKTI